MNPGRQAILGPTRRQSCTGDAEQGPHSVEDRVSGIAEPDRGFSGRCRHQDRAARPKERTEPGARCGSPAARLVVDVGADRHSGIDQLGKTRRQLGTVLQPLIGERPHRLEPHDRVLRFCEALVFGGYRQFRDYGAGPFERRPRNVESGCRRRLRLVP